MLFAIPFCIKICNKLLNCSRSTIFSIQIFTHLMSNPVSIINNFSGLVLINEILFFPI